MAICNHTGEEERTCTCKPNYIGDGFTCRGNIYQVTQGMFREVNSASLPALRSRLLRDMQESYNVGHSRTTGMTVLTLIGSENKCDLSMGTHLT